MHVALLQDRCITHVNMKQDVHTQMPDLQYLDTVFLILKTINYGQILYRITLLPFRHVYQQDYHILNHVKGLYLDGLCMGFFTF